MSLSSSGSKKMRTSNRCRQLLRKGNQPACYLCDSQVDLEVHHIDWHHENDNPDNLVTLCHRCHMELHRSGYVSRQELDGIRDKIRAERTPGEVAVSRRRQEGAISDGSSLLPDFLSPESNKLYKVLKPGWPERASATEKPIEAERASLATLLTEVRYGTC